MQPCRKGNALALILYLLLELVSATALDLTPWTLRSQGLCSAIFEKHFSKSWVLGLSLERVFNSPFAKRGGPDAPRVSISEKTSPRTPAVSRVTTESFGMFNS